MIDETVAGAYHVWSRTVRRASTKGFLEISFVEQLELLDALVRRERIELSGGTSTDFRFRPT